jgi:hypothetical protein
LASDGLLLRNHEKGEKKHEVGGVGLRNSPGDSYFLQTPVICPLTETPVSSWPLKNQKVLTRDFMLES